MDLEAIQNVLCAHILHFGCHYHRLQSFYVDQSIHDFQIFFHKFLELPLHIQLLLRGDPVFNYDSRIFLGSWHAGASTQYDIFKQSRQGRSSYLAYD